MAEKFKEQAVIIRQEEISYGIYSMWLKTDKIAGNAKPGQFISIYCHEGSRLLPRPISICEIDRADQALRIVYRVQGKGTEEFSKMRTGGSVDIVGPLGNGFPLKGKKAFLIGGGIGIPPLLQLAKELKCDKQLVLGYQDSLFLQEEFKRLCNPYVATEDGSYGTEGNVMDSREWLRGRNYLCLRAHAHAPRGQGLCAGEEHRVLGFLGRAYGLRNWRMSWLRLQFQGEGCAYECKQQANL